MCLARKGTVSIVIWNTKVQNGTTDLYSSKLSLVTVNSFGDSIMLIVALCFHSVFEGIAIGVAETEADTLLLVIMCAYVDAFAISGPIGVAIGIIINAMVTAVGACVDCAVGLSHRKHRITVLGLGIAIENCLDRNVYRIGSLIGSEALVVCLKDLLVKTNPQRQVHSSLQISVRMEYD
ncbi:hypothetical protein ACOSQ4_010118 [Xanthoceras sorbifolium]